jgi:hypothetical protein
MAKLLKSFVSCLFVFNLTGKLSSFVLIMQKKFGKYQNHFVDYLNRILFIKTILWKVQTRFNLPNPFCGKLKLSSVYQNHFVDSLN